MKWKKFFVCDPEDSRTSLDDGFDIFTPVFLLISMIFVWAILLKQFQKKDIHYREVLLLQDDHILRAWDVFLWAIWMLILTIISLITFTAFRHSGHIGGSTISGITLYILILLGSMLYFKIRHQDSLGTFCKTLFNILIPTSVPNFREIFLTDVLTSLTKVLAGMVSAVSLLHHLRGAKCIDQHLGPRSAVAVCITCFPFFYRLVQSAIVGIFRNKPKQFLNVLKHALTITMTIVSSMKYLMDDERLWYKTFGGWWIGLVVLNTIACFLWDFSEDWNLRLADFIQEGNLRRHPDVDSKFIPRHKWLYHVIVAVDFAFRASWGFRLSTHLFTNRWVLLAMSVIEIVRRGMWIPLRIEAQYSESHLWIVHKFQVDYNANQEQQEQHVETEQQQQQQQQQAGDHLVDIDNGVAPQHQLEGGGGTAPAEGGGGNTAPSGGGGGTTTPSGGEGGTTASAGGEGGTSASA